MNIERRTNQQRLSLRAAALLSSGLVSSSFSALAQTAPPVIKTLAPNNLVVSRSVYDNKASNVTVGQILPPNCAKTLGKCGGPATYNGTYPYVFNNDTVDGSFGITSPIYLDEISLVGQPLGTLAIPSTTAAQHMVTSFSSKSELGLNLSTDGRELTFMGYVTVPDQLDISNSNTPMAIDMTNPDGQTPTYRTIVNLDVKGGLKFSETNAYSGNNGRAAILNNNGPYEVYYTAGNAGNGANPQPGTVVVGAGAQLVTHEMVVESAQNPGYPTPIGSFSVTELGQPADKIGKDDNFRGMTVFNNVLYYSKGSGGNGVNTIYFVDTTGKACPNGVGLPAAGAAPPTVPLSYNLNTVATTGLPNNMCILAGFPTTPAKTANPLMYPFGLFFADANTLYVADEGDGYTGTAASGDIYTHAAAQTTAGLQKWVFNPTTKLWSMAYVLKSQLGIGTPYTVAGYPTGNNVNGLPWAPATDGLRNITGLVGPYGLVAIWGITSTVSGNGDQGADPNKMFVVLDLAPNTDPSFAAETGFFEVKDAGFAEVLRGVSFTPGTNFAAYKNLLP